jgi:hypothetical protein
MQVRQSRVCAVDCFRLAADDYDDERKTKAEEAQASRVEIAAGRE